jgi:hypothetical protein
VAITTASSVTTNGVLTVASVSTITTRQTVRLTGTPFGGLIANQTYYIIAVGSSTITLSLTAYGTAISIAGGTGTMTVTTGPAVGPGRGSIPSADVVGDYNTIQAIVSKVLGPPTDADPTYGYNQLVTSSQVAAGNKIALLNYPTLRADMIRARGHQTGNPSEANNISLPTSLSLVSEDTRLEYLNYANVIDTYRNSIGLSPSVQFSAETAVVATRITAWNGNISSRIDMGFGDNPTMRSYFNAGGTVKFSVVMSGVFNLAPAATVKDNTWNQMFTEMGTITFDRAGTTLEAGSTGTTTSIGFSSLDGTTKTIFTKNAPSGLAYASNRFLITATVSNGTLTFICNYQDLSTGAAQINYLVPVAGSQFGTTTNSFTPGGVPDEYVDGIITQNCVLNRPAGSYVNVTAPTVTLTGDFKNSANAVYGLSADKYAVNEGDTVTIRLQTQNVANNTPVTYYCSGAITYTVNGLTFSRFSAGNPDSFFTVNNGVATISFTILNNQYTDGETSFSVNLYNGFGSVTIFINDTSTTPFGNSGLLSTTGPGVWTAPAGVRSATVLIVGGGGGGGDFGGGGGGAGQARVLSTTILPGANYYYNIGTGGGSVQSGGSSIFNGNYAFGGNPGVTGTSTGHGGTHTGGAGGTSGTSQVGGNGGSSTGTIMTLGGGGGGGSGGAGANGSATDGGRGGGGLAFTYYLDVVFATQTIYVGGGGGGGGTRGSDPTAYLIPGYYGGGPGGGMDSNGSAAPYYGGGGGGGGVSLSADAQKANSAGQLTATLSGKSGGQGANGMIWIFWPF